MESLESMLKERGFDPSDPTVKFAMGQKLCFGGPQTARKHIPKEYLGKNEYGQVRNQPEARQVVSKVFQIRSEFDGHASKYDLIRKQIRKMKQQKRRSPLVHKLRTIDQFQPV